MLRITRTDGKTNEGIRAQKRYEQDCEAAEAEVNRNIVRRRVGK